MVNHSVLRNPELLRPQCTKVKPDNALRLEVEVEETAVVDHVVVALRYSTFKIFIDAPSVF